MKQHKVKTKRELRNFGFVMMVPLLLIAGYLLWKGKSAAPYVAGVALFFGLAALIAPGILRPIESAWMKFAEVLGAIMTRVILTLTFYLVVTPIGLLKRIFGNDSLGLKFDHDADSYWLPADKEGTASRYDKPF